MLNTLIAAGSHESAAARAAQIGLEDSEWALVQSIADLGKLEGEGALLFADDWREAFDPDNNTESEEDGPTPFIMAAHAHPRLLVEVTI